MRRLPPAIALLAACLTTPAAAQDVVERVFQVTYREAGREYVSEASRVPFLPRNACYSWYLRVAAPSVELDVVERLTLPQAVDWGGTGSTPDDPTQVEAGGAVAVTTLPTTTDESGWFSHGWCVAEGDPLGQHSIELSIAGEHVARFDFEVVTPEQFGIVTAFAASPVARSVRNSW